MIYSYLCVIVMNQYIPDTEFAVRTLFDVITHDLTQIASLKTSMQEVLNRARRIYIEAHNIADQDIDDLETPGMIANRYSRCRLAPIFSLRRLPALSSQSLCRFHFSIHRTVLW